MKKYIKYLRFLIKLHEMQILYGITRSIMDNITNRIAECREE